MAGHPKRLDDTIETGVGLRHVLVQHGIDYIAGRRHAPRPPFFA
jgi:hypothetical protein